MKKNNWTLLLFCVGGLFIGTLLAHAVFTWTGWGFMSQGMPLIWQPKGDLGFLVYDLHLELKLNIGSFAGIALGIWMFRRW